MPTLEEIIANYIPKSGKQGPPLPPAPPPTSPDLGAIGELIASGQLPLSPHSPRLPGGGSSPTGIDAGETLKEDLNRILFNIAPKSPGILKVLPEAVKHPIDTTVLGPLDTLLTGAKRLGQTLLNIPNALSVGVKFPGSLDPALPVPSSLSEVPSNALYRIERLANAAMLGLPDFVSQTASTFYPPGAANPYTREPGTELPIEKHLLFGLAAIPKAIIGTPLAQAISLLKGETMEGEPLTGRTLGRDVTALALSALPVFGTIQAKGLRQIPREAARKSQIYSTWRTEGEIIEAGRQAAEIRSLAARKGALTRTLDQLEELYTSKTEKPPSLKPTTLTDLEAHFLSSEAGIFDNPTFQLVINDAIRSNVWDNLSPRLYAAGTPATKVVADVIRRGGISDETINLLRDQYGLPPAATAEAIREAVANVVEATASHRGKGLSMTSNLLRQRLDEALLAIRRDRDPEALRAFLRLRRNLQTLSADPSLNVLGRAETAIRAMGDTTARQFLKKVETVWLSSMLSQPKTAIRNIRSQTGIFLSQILGDLATGVVETISGIKQRRGFNFDEYFADLDSSFFAAATALKRAVRRKDAKATALDEIIASIPEMGDVMLSSSQHQAFGSALADVYTAFMGARKRGGTVKESLQVARDIAKEYSSVELYRDVLMSAMRTQEIFFRKLFFDSRLRANLKAIGFKGGYAKLLEEVRNSPTLSTPLREAIDDAFLHSMRATLANNPETSFGRAFLRAMNSVPLLPKWGLIPFPRFLTNQMRFMMERNPGQILELFNPEVQQLLFDYTSNNRIASKKAARRIGKAVEGMVLFGAALSIRSDPKIAGPKYWQVIDHVDKDGTIYYEDYRTQQPFAQLLGLADVAKAIADGKSLKDLPYSAAEWVDLAINLPRLGDQFFFNIPAIPQLALKEDTDDLLATVLLPVGQFFSAFAMPAKVVQDFYSELTGGESYSYDVRGEELTGPLRAQMSAFLPESLALPARIDPTTGEKVTFETPIADQLTGVITRQATKFRQWMDATPGVKMQDLLGRPGSPEAERLVGMITGSILTLRPDEKGPTLGSTLADLFNDPEKFSPEMRKEILKIILSAVREAAQETAFSLRPDLFPEKMAQLSTIPEPFKPSVDDMIKRIIGKMRAEGIFKQPRSIP